ncbi:hypothetical protein LINPERPRIM_LOCUS13246 [Linum perenne]
MAIKRISIGPNDLADEWKWRFSRNGQFTFKSAYHVCHNEPQNGRINALQFVPEANWKWLWSLSLPTKITFFLWRASAEDVIVRMQGQIIGQQQVRIFWGQKQVFMVQHNGGKNKYERVAELYTKSARP